MTRFLSQPHRYHERVRLVGDPITNSLLARLACEQRLPAFEAHRIVTALFRTLFYHAFVNDFPRMQQQAHPEPPPVVAGGRSFLPTLHGPFVQPDAPTIITLAKVKNYELALEATELLQLVGAREQPRFDLFGGLNRRQASIVGSSVFIPHLVGATGETMSTILTAYGDPNFSRPRSLSVLHIVVTPEYLHRMRQAHPEVIIYALRVDRGCSPPDVLTALPGERWSEEHGIVQGTTAQTVPGLGRLAEHYDLTE